CLILNKLSRICRIHATGCSPGRRTTPHKWSLRVLALTLRTQILHTRRRRNRLPRKSHIRMRVRHVNGAQRRALQRHGVHLRLRKALPARLPAFLRNHVRSGCVSVRVVLAGIRAARNSEDRTEHTRAERLAPPLGILRFRLAGHAVLRPSSATPHFKRVPSLPPRFLCALLLPRNLQPPAVRQRHEPRTRLPLPGRADAKLRQREACGVWVLRRRREWRIGDAQRARRRQLRADASVAAVHRVRRRRGRIRIQALGMPVLGIPSRDRGWRQRISRTVAQRVIWRGALVDIRERIGIRRVRVVQRRHPRVRVSAVEISPVIRVRNRRETRYIAATDTDAAAALGFSLGLPNVAVPGHRAILADPVFGDRRSAGIPLDVLLIAFR
ncbi:unnamed protein product, partial [Mycena citricolor]